MEANSRQCRNDHPEAGVSVSMPKFEKTLNNRGLHIRQQTFLLTKKEKGGECSKQFSAPTGHNENKALLSLPGPPPWCHHHQKMSIYYNGITNLGLCTYVCSLDAMLFSASFACVHGSRLIARTILCCWHNWKEAGICKDCGLVWL